MMTTATPPAERLLNLVIALMNTSGRLTRRDIQQRVSGYAPDADPKTFERMFERDKDTLRELGVPIQTVNPATDHAEDIGYRIDKDSYSLTQLDLNAAELSILSLATTLWRDTALEADSTRALTKLKSNAPTTAPTTALAGFGPRIRGDEPSLTVILDAITARRAIRFTYRAASTGELTTRTIHPWRLSSRRGGWYAVGYDTTRNDARVFRLNRIVGHVKALGPQGAYELPDTDTIAHAFGQDLAHTPQQATLALARGRAQALRARSHPAATTAPHGYDAVHLTYVDENDMSIEIAGLGAHALVLDPPALAHRVIAHHKALAELARTLGEDPLPDRARTDTTQGEDTQGERQ